MAWQATLVSQQAPKKQTQILTEFLKLIFRFSRFLDSPDFWFSLGFAPFFLQKWPTFQKSQIYFGLNLSKRKRTFKAKQKHVYLQFDCRIATNYANPCPSRDFQILKFLQKHRRDDVFPFSKSKSLWCFWSQSQLSKFAMMLRICSSFRAQNLKIIFFVLDLFSPPKLSKKSCRHFKSQNFISA